MNEQVTLLRTTDQHPVGTEPELSGDANGLAVAIHKDTAGEGIHDETCYVCAHKCAVALALAAVYPIHLP